MYAIKINIQDEIFDKFKNSIKVDDISYYPTISFEEAQQQVARSILDIDKGNGVLVSEEETFKILEEV